MANYQWGYYIDMVQNNRPVFVLLPVEDCYLYMNDMVIEEGVYEMPFSVMAFNQFMSDILDLIMVTNVHVSEGYIVENAAIYVGYGEAYSLVRYLKQVIIDQLIFLKLPVTPVAGYHYRHYITGSLEVHVHYQPSDPIMHIKQTHTRESILECIENGDYISERIKRDYGI